MGDINIERLYDIKKTELELVQDRGYEISAIEYNALIIPEDKEYDFEENYDYFQVFSEYLTTLDENNDPNKKQYWTDKGFNVPGIENFNLNNLQALIVKFNKNKNDRTDHPLFWHNYWNENYNKSLLIYHVNQQAGEQTSKDSVQTFVTLFEHIRKIIIKGSNIQVDAILVVNVPPSAEAGNILKTYPRVQVFFESELTYNPSLHIDNQLHTLITKDKTKELLVTLKTERSKLPNIKTIDATSKYFGFSASEVIRIDRTDRYVSILSPKSVNYRVVTV